MTASALFNTAVMGMTAQTTALGAISENISNSGTVGYKEVTTQFSTLLSSFQGGEEVGGGVAASTRTSIEAQGTPQVTSSSTDLAIQGSGFFVVSNSAGQLFLTRAGSFVPDEQGRLVNSAGYYLMGKVDPNGNATIDDGGSLQIVTVPKGKMISTPSTSGALTGNLAVSAALVAPPADLPSTNVSTSSYSYKTSMTTYDDLGQAVTLDVYFAKTGSDNWEMSVYDASGATNGGFPYSSSALASQTLTFDMTNGSLLSGNPATIAIPGGESFTLDVSALTQLGADSGVRSSSVNGNLASSVSGAEVSSDGRLSYTLGSGKTIPAFVIAMGDVPSANGLTAMSGNVYAESIELGADTLRQRRQGGSRNDRVVTIGRFDRRSRHSIVDDDRRAAILYCKQPSVSGRLGNSSSPQQSQVIRQ